MKNIGELMFVVNGNNLRHFKDSDDLKRFFANDDEVFLVNGMDDEVYIVEDELTIKKMEQISDTYPESKVQGIMLSILNPKRYGNGKN